MRRSSFAPVGPLEPLIVVEESPSGEADAEEDAEGAVGGAEGGGTGDSRDDDGDGESTPPCESDQMPNPYLLCPWRDTRKGSLPTPTCTSGITASQVRRLSERGPESGPSPREQAFLATLSAAPAPQPGGRRHSVVTICRAPPTSVIFGRNRRESIAVLGAGLRRDSSTSSSHNLALDIMDDIAEVKAARKGRVGASGASSPSRRFSDVGAGWTAATPQPRRRSEQPSTWQVEEGIVCSNSDLMTIITSVASSTQDIDKVEEENEDEVRAAEQEAQPLQKLPEEAGPTSIAATRKQRLQSFRSNSFDVGMLVGKLSQVGRGEKRTSSAKVPSTRKTPSAIMVTLQKDKPTVSLVSPPSPPRSSVEPVATPAATPATPKPPPLPPRKGSTPAGADGAEERSKVVWDGRSGSLVDAHLLGSAIEGFLNKDATPDKQKKEDARRQLASTSSKAAASISSWFSSLSTWTGASQPQPPARPGPGPGTGTGPGPGPGPGPGAQASGSATPTRERANTPSDTCNTLCSTLKDLFVK